MDSTAKIDESKNVFYKTGFSSWHKALEKFRGHEKHKDHVLAISNKIHAKKSLPIEAQLISQVALEQAKARNSLVQIFSAVKYLARQNIAIRGHEDSESNMMQLLDVLKVQNLDLNEWLCKRKSWTSWKIQNKMIYIMSRKILEKLCQGIRESECFALIVDGTQDISGTDQHSMCIRFTDRNIQAREEFVGFYEVKETTGQEIADVILKVLKELELPIGSLRWQTYDGAANMSGFYKGVQAVIRVPASR